MLEVSRQTETIAKKRIDLVRIIATNIEVTAFLWSLELSTDPASVEALGRVKSIPVAEISRTVL